MTQQTFLRAGTLQTIAANIPYELLATRSNQRSVIAYLRALTLTVWLGSLVLNFWWKTDWYAMMDYYRTVGVENVKGDYYIGFAIVVVGHLTLGLQRWISAPFGLASTWCGKLLTAFCLLMLLTAPLSISLQQSVIYAIATWFVLVVCYLYWKGDFDVARRVLVFSGLVLFAWLALLLVHHGLVSGFGSGIGGVNRNATGAVAATAMVCCMCSVKKSIRIGGLLAAAFFATIVTSRGTLLAICVFSAVYYALYKGTGKAAFHATLTIVLVATVLLVSTVVQKVVLQDVLRVDDPMRGLGTGFSGRFEKWQRGLEVLWERPIVGHGFRATAPGGVGGGAHGGYVQILVESGCVGAFLVLAAVGSEAVRRMRLAQRFRNLQPRDMPGIDVVTTAQLNMVACATICTVLTYWIYEPLYMNLGSTISIVFFLMLTAPSYIGAQTVPMRP
jgi:O-antigen ligase